MILELIHGIPSAYSRGFDTDGAAQVVPRTFNMMDKNRCYVVDEQGGASWSPAFPTTKNGGVWVDSPVSDGRVPVAASDSNVIETIQLAVIGSTLAKSATISELYRYAKAAREYWTEGNGQSEPVSLHFQPCTGLDHHAVIYQMDIEADQDPFLDTEAPVYVTLTIEREPAWRWFGYADNPKALTLENRGLVPGEADTPTTYTWQRLALNDPVPPASIYSSLVQLEVGNYDEIPDYSGQVRNFIDIPASLIKGDAEALALISFSNPPTGIGRLYLSRSTRRDLFPSDPANRARNTFNAVDATILTPTNMTVSRVTDAGFGLRGVGTGTTRYVGQIDTPVGAVSPERCFTWTGRVNQFPGRYAAFMRGTFASESGWERVNFMLQWTFGTSNLNLQQTDRQVRASANARAVTYLGVVDFTQSGDTLVSVNGAGLDTASTFSLHLLVGQFDGGSGNNKYQLQDIVLMPIDEPNGLIDFPFASLSGTSSAFMDSTGYLSAGRQRDFALSYQSLQNAPRPLYGSAITLKPGVDNRIYLLASGMSNALNRGVARVDIIPRTYGMRGLE